MVDNELSSWCWNQPTKANRKNIFWRMCHGFESIQKEYWETPKIRLVSGREKGWVTRWINEC